MDYLQQWQSPSGQGLVGQVGFQGQNNGLHHIIKKCITEYTPSEAELGRLLDRLILAFHTVSSFCCGFVLGGFFI